MKGEQRMKNEQHSVNEVYVFHNKNTYNHAKRCLKNDER
jgi:hypothetical protein